MNRKFVPALLLALSITGFAAAQTKEGIKKEKEENGTIRKRSNSNEKVTIVIDGDNITVNGKPMENLRDSDIESLRNLGVTSFMPKLRMMGAPRGSMKMFGGDDFNGNFNFNGNRSFLGVVSEKNDKGAKITSVEKESAAEKAGLKKDDIITKIGDEKIESSQDLYETMGKYKPEDKVTITYDRNGRELSTTAVLGKTRSGDSRSFKLNGNDFNLDMLPSLPRMNGGDFSFNRKPRLGLEIQDVEEGKGVKILDVDSDTPAGKAGLQKDDVISDIDGTTIDSVDDLRNKVSGLKEGDSLRITFRRNGKTQTTELKLPKKLKTAEL